MFFILTVVAVAQRYAFGKPQRTVDHRVNLTICKFLNKHFKVQKEKTLIVFKQRKKKVVIHPDLGISQ